jgi:hypothetical protein
MKTRISKNSLKDRNSTTKNGKNSFPINSVYSPEDDIYSKSKKEENLNPEDISKTKTPNDKVGELNEKDFEEDVTGDDLDVPGAELDDQQEEIGSEDEENNYYSIGGDAHNNLEEDKEGDSQ